MTAATTTGSINPLVQGFLLCASIIIAFGTQYLFILRQGLRRQNLFATALFSLLADVILIAVGVGGLSALISTSSFLQTSVSVAGTIFLVWYGCRSLTSACRPGSPAECSTSHTPSTSATGIQTTIAATLAFSFLNPAKYLDTLVIIGSKSLFFPGDERLVFGIGAVLASTFWFFTLAYGASRLSPMFRSPVAWRALEFVSGCIMLGVAITLLASCRLSP